jgi:erythromycin esterase-like protein
MVARRSRLLSEIKLDSRLSETVSSFARPLHGYEDLDPLIERVGDSRFVLLGEASHGTAEFYDWRRLISQRLIREKGFSFVAVEGDWPDCYRVNRYVKNYPESGHDAHEVLHAFERWPTWMWANREVVTLAEWLRRHNASVADDGKAGFYGLDVYSLWESMQAVLGYLSKIDSSALAAARKAFECFEPYADDAQEYARATVWAPASCEDDVVRMLEDLRRQKPQYDHDGRDAYFNAEQNALVAKNAEHYYRTMVRGDSPSWNVRDRHMVETLNRLLEHHGPESKAIIWEHNTHIGDARYTDMAATGMVNVGQLVREEHAAEGVVLIGFSSYAGSVIAADQWGAPMRRMRVPPGRSGSWEDVLHRATPPDKLLIFDARNRERGLLEERGHRAIGVVYRPDYEGYGNYVPTVLPYRYDALLFIDESHAVHPLHMPIEAVHELPETYPSGM